MNIYERYALSGIAGPARMASFYIDIDGMRTDTKPFEGCDLRISLYIHKDSHEVVLERVDSLYNVLERQSAGTLFDFILVVFELLGRMAGMSEEAIDGSGVPLLMFAAKRSITDASVPYWIYRQIVHFLVMAFVYLLLSLLVFENWVFGNSSASTSSDPSTNTTSSGDKLAEFNVTGFVDYSPISNVEEAGRRIARLSWIDMIAAECRAIKAANQFDENFRRVYSVDENYDNRMVAVENLHLKLLQELMVDPSQCDEYIAYSDVIPKEDGEMFSQVYTNVIIPMINVDVTALDTGIDYIKNITSSGFEIVILTAYKIIYPFNTTSELEVLRNEYIHLTNESFTRGYQVSTYPLEQMEIALDLPLRVYLHEMAAVMTMLSTLCGEEASKQIDASPFEYPVRVINTGTHITKSMCESISDAKRQLMTADAKILKSFLKVAENRGLIVEAVNTWWTAMTQSINNCYTQLGLAASFFLNAIRFLKSMIGKFDDDQIEQYIGSLFLQFLMLTGNDFKGIKQELHSQYLEIMERILLGIQRRVPNDSTLASIVKLDINTVRKRKQIGTVNAAFKLKIKGKIEKNTLIYRLSIWDDFNVLVDNLYLSLGGSKGSYARLHREWYMAKAISHQDPESIDYTIKVVEETKKLMKWFAD